MKRTIFFDLGNVLIFFDHQKMCRQVAEYSSLDEQLVQSVMHKYGDLYERGHVNSQMIHDELCRMAQKKLHFATMMHAVSDIFEPNEPVIATAHHLKEKGHRLFLLSNTCEAHFTFASNHFPFLKIFDGYVLSYEVGARKPEKKIYEKALEIAGCQNKKECFYTDDILPYIESARSMEIDAEQYTNPQELTQHLHARGML
ncbi:MAG: HAD family phosphatase [Verrucomicrobia bacterium]|nr:HAD family phosphatase [Verrucomicrobiota bacterium]